MKKYPNSIYKTTIGAQEIQTQQQQQQQQNLNTRFKKIAELLTNVLTSCRIFTAREMWWAEWLLRVMQTKEHVSKEALKSVDNRFKLFDNI